MLSFSEEDARVDLPYVLEQARVRGAVRVRREDGQAFIIIPAAAGSLSDRLADEQETWLNTLAPVVTICEDLACAECGYNLRNLPASHRCPESGRPVEQTIESVSAANPALRFHLRAVQARSLAEAAHYPPDALLFLVDAIVTYCRHALRSLPQGPVALSPPQVCTAVREFARRYFNNDDEAGDLLAEWKLRRSEDVGAALRILTQAGALAITGCDAEHAFDNLFTPETLFAPR